MGTTGYKSYQYETAASKFDFYSGSQITVWFGNVMIDDINSIQWMRTQSKRPVYGYASQLMDTVCNGIVMIQGSFTINFRHSGYMAAVMEGIKKIYQVLSTGSPLEKDQFDAKQWPVVNSLISSHLKNGTFGPQTPQQIIDIGNSPDFFELAKLYEQTVWQEMTSADAKYKDSNKRAGDVAQSIIIPDGFNILISYGNPGHVEKKTFSDHMKSANKSLDGVHLVGESQMIQVGGQPVQEQYSFIAKDTDNTISRV